MEKPTWLGRDGGNSNNFSLILMKLYYFQFFPNQIIKNCKGGRTVMIGVKEWKSRTGERS